MKIYRCFPTLDVSIDVKAETEEKALEIMSDRIKEIREEFVEKLYNLGFLECGCDFDYSTDEWDESWREEGDPVPITESDIRLSDSKTVCLYSRNDGYTYIFSSKLGWVAYPTLDDENPNFLNPIHVEDLNIPDQKKNALLAWLEGEERHHGLVREPDQGEIPDYDWWKNDPVEIFRKRLGEYETELVTVYGIDDPKSWVVHHQDATGTLNYQREFNNPMNALDHAKSLKMHFDDAPLAEGVTPKFHMI